MVSLEDYGTYETAWCPGCGNFSIIRAVKQALVEAGLRPHQVLFVSGIGQAAKAPHYFNANVLNGLHGRTLPAATGAKLANPDRQVISITGDGAFMFNIQDLETAARLKLGNLIYIVGNNSAWGSMKSIQKLTKEQRYIDVEFGPFDFARCAESFGCYGESVTEPDELQPALERAMDSNKPAVIDVKLKYETAAMTELLISVSL